MDFLLDGQKVYESLMDDAVRVMTPGREQSAEGILHRTGYRGIDVTFRCGEMHNVCIAEEGGYLYTFRINPVQHSHSRLRMNHLPGHMLRQKVIFLRNTVSSVHRCKLV